MRFSDTIKGVGLLSDVPASLFFRRVAPELEYRLRIGALSMREWEAMFDIFADTRVRISLGAYVIAARPGVLELPALQEWTAEFVGALPKQSPTVIPLFNDPFARHSQFLRAMLWHYGFEQCGSWPRWIADNVAAGGVVESVILTHLAEGCLSDVRFFLADSPGCVDTLTDLKLHLSHMPTAYETCARRAPYLFFRYLPHVSAAVLDRLCAVALEHVDHPTPAELGAWLQNDRLPVWARDALHDRFEQDQQLRRRVA